MLLHLHAVTTSRATQKLIAARRIYEVKLGSHVRQDSTGLLFRKKLGH